MAYLKKVFFNFLIIFFANYVLPGMEVTKATKLPHIGGDILFPLALGVLNAAIYPLVKLAGRSHSAAHIALIALVINFLAYAILKILPIEIQPVTVEGYIFPALVVSIGSFLTNFFEMKAHRPPTIPP